MLLFLLSCFFNGTATTDIYTYGLTLSLRDALPIYGRWLVIEDVLDRQDDVDSIKKSRSFLGAVARREVDRRHPRDPHCRSTAKVLDGTDVVRIEGQRERTFRPACGGARTEMRRIEEDSRRSEEHTSELQSLMRISYAVFCLK